MKTRVTIIEEFKTTKAHLFKGKGFENNLDNIITPLENHIFSNPEGTLTNINLTEGSEQLPKVCLEAMRELYDSLRTAKN